MPLLSLVRYLHSKGYFCKKIISLELIEALGQYIKVDDAIRNFLLTETETKTYPKNNLLVKCGQFNKTVFFMEKGLARNFYLENGNAITANFYMEGKTFGSIDTIFTRQPTRYCIETLEESVITSCNYEKLENFCATSLPAANFSRFLIGNMMTQTLNRLTSLQHMTAREKYEQLLQNNPGIILRAPLGMIASYLGISQETLSRIRN